MATLTTTQIVLYILAIAVGLTLLIGFLFSLSKGKSATEALKDLLPDFTLGQKPLQAGTPSIPAQQQEEFKKFKEKIEQLMAPGSKSNCFIKHDGFSKFPETMSIKIFHDSVASKTTFSVFTRPANSNNELFVSSFEIPSLVPCVVGGVNDKTKEPYSEGFYNNYLRDGGNKAPIFNPMDTIVIALDDGGWTGFTMNRINYGSGFINFEGDEWLYKPNENHVCFFPTVTFGNDEEGLDYDYLNKLSLKDSLPYQIQKNPADLLCFGDITSILPVPIAPEPSPSGIKRGTN